eukprot:13346663-Alexandrium_andersonii.AAC.1
MACKLRTRRACKAVCMCGLCCVAPCRPCGSHAARLLHGCIGARSRTGPVVCPLRVIPLVPGRRRGAPWGWCGAGLGPGEQGRPRSFWRGSCDIVAPVFAPRAIG